MSRPITAPAILFLATIAVFCPPVCRATIVEPRVVECPIDRYRFVVLSFVTYTIWEEPSHRDMTDSWRGGLVEIRTCPRCLYSALPWKFDMLSPQEVRDVQEILPRLAMVANDRAREFLGQASASESMTSWLLALICNEQRDLTREEWFDFMMAGYCTGAREVRPAAGPSFRARVIESLRQAMDAHGFSDAEHSVIGYLLAELLRLEGRHDEAIPQFDRALQLLRRLPADARLPYGSPRLERLIEWASQQRKLAIDHDARFVGLRARIPTEEDRGRREKVRAVLDGLHSRLLVEHEVKKGDTLTTLARSFTESDHVDRGVRRILDLNPRIDDPNTIHVGQKVLVPAWPEGLSERQFVKALCELAGEGDLRCAPVMATWVTTISDFLELWQVLGTLRAHPPIARAFLAQTVTPKSSHQELCLAICRAACGDSDSRRKLKDLYPPLDESGKSLVLHVMAQHHDRSMVSVVSRELEKRDVRAGMAASYLSAVGGDEEQRFLEREKSKRDRFLVPSKPLSLPGRAELWEARDLCDAIRAVRVRLAFASTGP